MFKLIKCNLTKKDTNETMVSSRKLMMSGDNPLLARGRVRTMNDVNNKADKLILKNNKDFKSKLTKIKENVCQKIKTKLH